MKVENKHFWERDEVINTQDQEITTSSDFEQYLFKVAKTLTKISRVKIFGCGTGREINEINKFFELDSIVASDISSNMIKKCNHNLVLWNIKDKVETITVNAADFKGTSEDFDMVTLMNSMLTYVWKATDREKIFSNCYAILKKKGIIIGVVHNQEGALKKTMYFKVRRLLKPFLKYEVGYRFTGFKGFKVPGYYYDQKGLINQLVDAGFKKIEVLSLEDFYKSNGKVYNRKTGYNNLIFIAQKP